jgi:hypothetical protein
MSKFVLTAQLQLQAPTNTRQVISQLRSQLSGGLNIPVTVTGAAKAQKQITNVTNSTKQATNAAQNMGRSFGLAFKRFAAFTVASRAVSLFTNTLANAVDEAIDFQREIVKIAQVTGKAVRDLQGLEKTIFRLAKTLGVNSKELLSTTRILSQAGIQARDLEVALAALAKTTLAPTFEDIGKTAEGAIAIIAQFKQGVGALEGQLGSINAVAGQFAVESGDLIGAIRRTGGVFKEAGGSLDEFLGLFTSVRATTRESSESIATGLRTIFTRLQRPKTLDFLRQYGVELTDLEGKFVGPFEAVKRLNAAIGGLEQGDITFIKIAEEIAGFRQIGKVIPLIKEFELAERARAAAIGGTSSLADDAAKAQQALAVQILKVKQEFQELIQGIANTSTFQAFVKTSLTLASALIKIADAIKPLIPLLAAMAAFKFARGLGGFASGLGGALRGASGKNQGGKILAFARGGMVPGQGNSDTVPAMLSPGEFVIRKSSVKKMGAGNLAAMNENRYGQGGRFDRSNPRGEFGAVEWKKHKNVFNKKNDNDPEMLTKRKKLLDKKEKQFRSKQAGRYPGGVYSSDFKKIGALILKPSFKDKGQETPQLKPISKGLLEREVEVSKGTQKGNKALLQGNSSFGLYFASRNNLANNAKIQQGIEDGTRVGLKRTVQLTAGRLANTLKIPGITGMDKKAIKNAANDVSNDKKGAVQTTEGYVLEGLFSAITGAKLAGGSETFDLPNMTGGSKDRIEAVFGAAAESLEKSDVKRSAGGAEDSDGGIRSKIIQDMEKSVFTGMDRYASGGSVKDTVPALLTPGEFVVNKSSAQSIGYNNLSSMNKSGVAKFNKGGVVGVQRFAEGGGVMGGGAVQFAAASVAIGVFTTALNSLGTEADGTKNAFGRVADVLITWGTSIAAAIYALKSFGFAVSAKGIKEAFLPGPKSIGGMIKAAGSAVKTGLGGGKFVGKNKQLHMGGKFANVEKMAPGMNLKGADAFGGQTSNMLKGITNLTSGMRGVALGVKAQIAGLLANTKALIMSTKFGKKIGGKMAGVRTKASNFKKNFKVGRQHSAMGGGSGFGARVGNFVGKSDSFISKQQRRVGRGLSSAKGKATDFGGSFMEEFNPTNKFGPRRLKGKGVAGKLGRGVGKIPGSKMLGRLGGSALKLGARGASMAAGGGAAAVGGLAGAALAAAGPIAAVAGVVALFSAGLNAAFDAQGKYNAAIQKGNVAEAEKYAVLKNVPGIVQLFGDGAAEAYVNLKSAFGGDSLKTIQQRAKVEALASKVELDKAKNTRDASEAMLKFQRGLGTAEEALAVMSMNFKNVKNQAKAERELSEGMDADKSTGGGAVGRNIAFWLGGGLLGMETAGAKNTRIESEQEKLKTGATEKDAQAFSSLRSATGPLQKSLILSGKSFEDFINAQGGFSQFSDDQVTKLKGDFEAQSKAIQANIAFIKSLNFGLRDINASANAAAVGMDIVAQAGEAGFNSFAASAQILEAAVSSAGGKISGGEMDSAITDLEGSLRQFGASDEQVNKTTGTLRGLQGAQAGVPAALEATKQELQATGDLSDINIKEVLGKNLLKGVEGPAKEKLAAAIENLKIDDKMRAEIQAGNLDKVLEQTLDPVTKAASEQAIGLLKKRAEMENKLIGSLSKRAAQEAEYISAQKAAIDMQLEAGKLFESFGGAKLTSGQQLGARIGQANLSLGNAGVAGLSGGGAGDIRRAMDDIQRNSSQQNARANIGVMAAGRGAGGTAGFAGAAGFDADKRDELKDANKAIVDFTKQRISLIQEELKIAQQKNKAEKDALDKLLGGDVEGFLEGQLAAAAGAALRTGDAGVAGAFGAGALGAGFKTLDGQGLDSNAMERAASLALSSVGVSDPRSAQVLAGNTTEEKGLKSQGRDLAQVLGDAAQQQATLERMDVTAATVVIKAQEMKIDQFNKNPEGALTGVEGFSRGGIVYANKGGFLRRGTDSVPAMLTPGEFVMNRKSVNSGNNLSTLQSMNSGGGGGGEGSAGLQEQFKQNVIDPLKQIFENSPLATFSNQFEQSVQKLMNFQLNVKVDPTNVTVNFQGGSFLSTLKEDIKNELLEKVKSEIGNAKFNESGDVKSKPGGLA